MNSSQIFRSNKVFEITLAGGQYFHSLQRDYRTLYENFSLLSYVARECEIKIIDRYLPDPTKPKLEVDEFEVQGNKWSLWQLDKSNFEAIKHLTISYEINSLIHKGESPKVQATFSTEVRNGTEYVHILINDPSNWFCSHLNSSKFKLVENRLSEHR